MIHRHHHRLGSNDQDEMFPPSQWLGPVQCCSSSRNQSWNSLQNINIFKFSDPNPMSWHRFSVPKHLNWIIGDLNKSKSWTKDATIYFSVAKAMLESRWFVHLPESEPYTNFDFNKLENNLVNIWNISLLVMF